jgi:hypothetical protein
MPPTREMLEGIAAHKLIELCLKTGGYDPEELVGRFIDRVEVTPEMADAVTDFVTDVRADMTRGAYVYIEHPFSLADYDAEMWGMVDALTYFPDLRFMRVRDYKHGAGVFVEAENNPQLKYYGLGGLLSLMVDSLTVDRAELCVYQPNAYQDAEPARSWEVEPAELLAFGPKLAAACAIARKPNAPLRPGPHCQFCPARGICPELTDTVLRATGSDVIPYTGDVMVPEPPRGMTSDQLGWALKMIPLIRTWINGVQALAYAEASHGRLPTGWKAVAKRTHRRWKDPELATRQALRHFAGELIEDDMYDRKIKTPAAFERLLGKSAVAGFISAHTEKPKGFTLVPANDEREAVPVGALAEFEIIEDDSNDAE